MTRPRAADDGDVVGQPELYFALLRFAADEAR